MVKHITRDLNFTWLTGKIKELKDMGVRIIWDDFGTGYGSLELLKDIPVEYIKFDMKFVKDIQKNGIDAENLKSLAMHTTIHNVTSCVKGIENESMLDIIRDFNIRSAQGFLFEKPVDVDVILEKYV